MSLSAHVSEKRSYQGHIGAGEIIVLSEIL